MILKNSKDVKGARELFTGLRNQVNSASSSFSDTLKAVMAEVVAKYDTVLAALPKDDTCGDWSLESQLENLVACLTSASATLTMSGLEISKLRDDFGKNLASAVTTEIERRITAGELVPKASLDTQVAAAITAKTAAGELIPKEIHTQLCSASKTAGITEGAEAERRKVTEVQQRETLIATRKESVQKAGFVLPDADLAKVLGETEENFTAAKTTAENRLKKLTDEGYQLNADLAANVWLDEVSFGRFEKILQATPSLKIKPEPFAGGPPAKNEPAQRFVV